SRILALAAGVACVLAAEVAVVGTMFPPDAEGRVELKVDEHAEVPIPDDIGTVRVTAHADLGAVGHESDVQYRVVLSRSGGREVGVQGTLTHRSTQTRRIRGGSVSTLIDHQTDARDVDVEGSGPLTVRLVSLGNSSVKQIEVAISRYSPIPELG